MISADLANLFYIVHLIIRSLFRNGLCTVRKYFQNLYGEYKGFILTVSNEYKFKLELL